MNGSWTEPPRQPALAEGETHVWLAHLSSAHARLEDFTRALSTDEQERAEKIPSLEQRARWRTTRGLLRILLARYLDTNASTLSLQYGAHGKPELKSPTASGLHFNTSHAGDHAVFAFTHAGDIGVDIECVRKDWPQCEPIARRFFAPGEQRALLAQCESERVRAFYTLWTRKEAFVKARGDGVFSGLDQFAVSLDEPRVLTVAGADARSLNWWMAALPSVAGYTGAVVVCAPSCKARFWNWNTRMLETNLNA